MSNARYLHWVSPARLAAKRVVPHANSTTETELNGIRIAEITGDNMPAAAMPMPNALYKKEIPKLKRTICVDRRDRSRIRASRGT
jgi:hypothetical protein